MPIARPALTEHTADAGLPRLVRDAAAWARLLTRDPDGHAADCPYARLLAPATAADGAFVLGRMAQSLDGRIATASGKSFWISGPDDILHTHRLRALFDAVVVGAATVQADDPLLTTRLCPGPSPVRVVIDTNRLLASTHRLFHDGRPTLVLCADDAAGPEQIGSAELLRLPRLPGSGLDLALVIERLAARGLKRIFVEGGGITVSRFLAARLLDRLHVTIAPLLLGAGIPAFTLPGVDDPQQGRRLEWSVYQLGADLLLDIPLERA